MMARKWEIKGMKELERSFKKLGKVPTSVASKSARAGARIAYKDARANAPEDTGELKRGIVLRRGKFRRRVPGRAVYNVMMDPAKNHIFVKETKDGKRYYYPTSQEYGFMTVDGKYIPGYRFMRRAIDDNEEKIRRSVLEVALKEVDKALKG